MAENDAGLDIEHWTGHTGCVIVAPHLAGTPQTSSQSSTKAEAAKEEKYEMDIMKNPMIFTTSKNCIQTYFP